ncbi:hypothetical protein GCM10010357_60760 [Streptomyces luteireticuli]|uniref:Uncharacterized protein n=1 Tax=Streptomyces luteireticuli TaxID=173858 RepID=A0ABP3IX39_9ACTN
MGHFRGLTWSDVRSLPLRDFNALVDAMADDVERQNKQSRRTRGRSPGGSTGERRTPVMT